MAATRTNLHQKLNGSWMFAGFFGAVFTVAEYLSVFG
jgi:hypothetical protein